MKPIISPTSPKKKIENEKDIHALYHSDLHSIKKPVRKLFSLSPWLLFVVVVISVVGGGLGALIWQTYGADIPWLSKLALINSEAQINVSQLHQSSNRSASVSDTEKLVNKLLPSVVSIYGPMANNTDNIPTNLLSGNRAGNGFILTDDGYIITSQKCLSGLSAINVVTPDNKIYEASLRLEDPASGLAVLKIAAGGLTTLNMSDFSSLGVGQNLFDVSINFPQTRYVASATIASKSPAVYKDLASAINTSEKSTEKIIIAEQLSSLFDNSIIYSDTGDAIGITSINNGVTEVVPFSIISPVLDSILQTKKIIRPFLGLRYLDLSKVEGIPINLTQGELGGALIYSDNENDRPSLVSGSPALKAGLKKNDLITAIDAQLIDTNNSLSDVILTHLPGETITVTYLRNKVKQTLKLILEDLPN